VQADPASGLPYPTAAFVTQHAPRANGTTHQVKALLTAISAKGGDIETLGGINLYFQQYKQGGLRETEALHRKVTIAKGVIVPRTLTVSYRQDATLSYEILIIGDGTNAPVLITDNVALPTVTVEPPPSGIEDRVRYSLGDIKVGGITLEGVRQVTIDFGLDAKTEGADSDVIDSFACIETWKPEARISGVNLEWLSSTFGQKIPLYCYDTGVAKLGVVAKQTLEEVPANTTIQLKKRAKNGLWDSAGHLTIAMAGLAYVDDAGSGSTGGYAEPSLVIAGIYDGTNDCITVS
jgi:hypothetical protein